MLLNKNWLKLLGVSYTAWAFYSLAFLTLAPDVIYKFFEVETSPKLWSGLQILVVLLGLFGRLVEQSEEKRWVRRAVIVILLIITSAFSASALDFKLWFKKAESKKEVQVLTGEPSWSQTSSVLTPLVARWEGKRNTAYLDIVNVPTICYGHTRTVTAQDVANKLTWSDQKCEALLKDELYEYWVQTRKGFTEETIKGRLTPDRDAAYSSLSFNVGWSGVRKSTATRRLNAGDILGGCEALTWWNKAGGRVVRGLVNRRSHEQELCMKGLT